MKHIPHIILNHERSITPISPYISGNREGLVALRNAIDDALETPKPQSLGFNNFEYALTLQQVFQQMNLRNPVADRLVSFVNDGAEMDILLEAHLEAENNVARLDYAHVPEIASRLQISTLNAVITEIPFILGAVSASLMHYRLEDAQMVLRPAYAKFQSEAVLYIRKRNPLSSSKEAR